MKNTSVGLRFAVVAGALAAGLAVSAAACPPHLGCHRTDWNADGTIDCRDYELFAADWNSGAPCAADYNGDGFDDFFDFHAYIEDYAAAGPPCHRACTPCDLNDDGRVDATDLALFTDYFAASRLCADFDLDGGVTGADFDAFLVCYEGQHPGCDGRPDLTAADFASDCGSGCQPRTTLRATVRNIGGGANVPVGVSVRFYAGDPTAGGTQIGATAFTTIVLPPGGSQAVSTTAAGFFFDPRPVFVAIDQENLVAEGNEANNTLATGVAIDCRVEPVNPDRECGIPLSSFLGGSPGGAVYASNPPFTVVTNIGPAGVGVDCPADFSSNQIEFCDTIPMATGIGMYPRPGATPFRVDFSLPAIREAICGVPTRFVSRVGIDVPSGGAAGFGARFIVMVDNVTIADVTVPGASAGSVPIDVAIPGNATTLSLLTVRVGGPTGQHASWGVAKLTKQFCCADVSGDGFLDFFDYDFFVQRFEAGMPCADYNHDNFIDFFDMDAFVHDFETGCQP